MHQNYSNSNNKFQLTRAVLRVLLILWMEIVNRIGHNIFRVHRFLCKTNATKTKNRFNQLFIETEIRIFWF